MAVLLLAAPLAAQAPAPDLPLWLTGCWRMTDPDRIIDEIWFPQAGGALLGVSRAHAGDSLLSYEVMVIRPGANGLLYEASPSGQLPATFLAGVQSDSGITFENLTHDFPQLIRYVRRGPDALLAVVSGAVRDRQRVISYEYQRVACSLP
ncbi:MAG: hypothetical protein IPI38_00895 [Gemmatimonadetes bacterium]|nr:hypothetical protein [Gemmatimonadota bacterium]